MTQVPPAGSVTERNGAVLNDEWRSKDSRIIIIIISSSSSKSSSILFYADWSSQPVEQTMAHDNSFPSGIDVKGSYWSMTPSLWIVLSLALLIGIIPPSGHVVDAFSLNDGLSSKKETLNVAFVTGNEMKVREIEMILSEEGAIDLEHPENSLGESDFHPRYMQ